MSAAGGDRGSSGAERRAAPVVQRRSPLPGGLRGQEAGRGDAVGPLRRFGQQVQWIAERAGVRELLPASPFRSGPRGWRRRGGRWLRRPGVAGSMITSHGVACPNAPNAYVRVTAATTPLMETARGGTGSEGSWPMTPPVMWAGRNSPSRSTSRSSAGSLDDHLEPGRPFRLQPGDRKAHDVVVNAQKGPRRIAGPRSERACGKHLRQRPPRRDRPARAADRARRRGTSSSRGVPPGPRRRRSTHPFAAAVAVRSRRRRSAGCRWFRRWPSRHVPGAGPAA